MHRCVEMGAGMLAHREVVPIPRGPATVVVRDFRDTERVRRRELGWKLDHRSRWPQRLRQVDHADSVAGNGCGEVLQQGGGRRRRGVIHGGPIWRVVSLKPLVTNNM